MELYEPDIYGPVHLETIQGSEGTILRNNSDQVFEWDKTHNFLVTDKVDQIFPSGEDDIDFTSPVSDLSYKIIYSYPGIFTIPKNRVYLAEASIVKITGALPYFIQWVDSSNNPVGLINIPAETDINPYTAKAFLKFNIDTDIKLRVISPNPITLSENTSVFIRTID